MTDSDLHILARQLIEDLRARQMRLVTVESCTGGMICATLTDISGSSDVIEGGFITYSNALKSALVNVPEALIEAEGAVSREVAQAMAVGGLNRAAEASICVSVTGIAGPQGGTAQKPVGTVWLAVATSNGVQAVRHLFSGDRDAVRRASVKAAIEMISLTISA